MAVRGERAKAPLPILMNFCWEPHAHEESCEGLGKMFPIGRKKADSILAFFGQPRLKRIPGEAEYFMEIDYA